MFFQGRRCCGLRRLGRVGEVANEVGKRDLRSVMNELSESLAISAEPALMRWTVGWLVTYLKRGQNRQLYEHVFANEGQSYDWLEAA